MSCYENRTDVILQCRNAHSKNILSGISTNASKTILSVSFWLYLLVYNIYVKAREASKGETRSESWNLKLPDLRYFKDLNLLYIVVCKSAFWK